MYYGIEAFHVSGYQIIKSFLLMRVPDGGGVENKSTVTVNVTVAGTNSKNTASTDSETDSSF